MKVSDMNTVAEKPIEEIKEHLTNKERELGCYVSGKIGDFPRSYVDEQFKRAAMYIHGVHSEFTAVLPTEINTWEKLDELLGLGITEAEIYKKFMLNDIATLWNCSAIAMLPNWQASKGARIEHAIAKELDLVVIYLPQDFNTI